MRDNAVEQKQPLGSYRNFGRRWQGVGVGLRGIHGVSDVRERLDRDRAEWMCERFAHPGRHQFALHDGFPPVAVLASRSAPGVLYRNLRARVAGPSRGIESGNRVRAGEMRIRGGNNGIAVHIERWILQQVVTSPRANAKSQRVGCFMQDEGLQFVG